MEIKDELAAKRRTLHSRMALVGAGRKQETQKKAAAELALYIAEKFFPRIIPVIRSA